MDKKTLLAFLKKAHRTNTLSSQMDGDDLLLSDGASLWRVPFPGPEWADLRLPDVAQAASIPAKGAPEPTAKDIRAFWQQWGALPALFELEVTHEGRWSGDDYSYPYLGRWACKLTAPDGFFLVQWDYLALLDDGLPFHTRIHTSDYRFEFLQPGQVRVSERLIWQKANGQREESWRPVCYLMPIKNASGLPGGPYFKTPAATAEAAEALPTRKAGNP